MSQIKKIPAFRARVYEELGYFDTCFIIKTKAIRAGVITEKAFGFFAGKF